MSKPELLITEHIDIWTSAILAKSTVGRGSNKKYELYGIKKLRELILELAVRGKLVPQNPNDEPASVLIKRIAAENAQLIRDNKFKKTLPFSKVTKDEELFELPEGWIWARIANLFNVVYGKGLPTSKLTNKGYDVFGANGIIGKYETYSYEESQLLVSCRGAYSGKANLSPPKCFITSNTLVLENSWNNLNKKFYYYSISAADKSQIVTGSAQPQVTAKNLNPFLVSIPPLQEQHRIVAKVDELMLLCDQLEQQTEASIDAHSTLVEVLLATLTDSADANELAQNWARVSEYFDSLFTTEKSIEMLKQTVLQLAVMGKLVPQDPDGEPASVLIAKIAAEKEQLIKDKKIKKAKPLPPIRDDEKPFELPYGWEWCRFGSVVNFKAELVKPEKYQDYEQVGPDSIEKGTGKLIKRRTVRESGITGPNSKFYSGQILYSKIRPSLSKAVIVDFDGLCSADMYPLEALINPDYLLTTILSEVFLAQVRDAENRIKMPKVNIESLSMMIIPLCSNQMMIEVTKKIDELIKICEQLKDKLQQSQVTQIQLTDALIDKALRMRAN